MTDRTRIVETAGRLEGDSHRAWDKVCFYEHIRLEPPLLLRLALPVPRETTGSCQQVGDTSRCIYSDGGYLTKRITHIESGRAIEFDIVEQSIRYHRGIKLRGGTIRIIGHDDGTSTVRMITRYECRYRPSVLAAFLAGFVIKAMHRIVIRDTQACLAAEVEPREGAAVDEKPVGLLEHHGPA